CTRGPGGLPAPAPSRRHQPLGGHAPLPRTARPRGAGRMTPKDRLIVALDLPDAARARGMVDRLAGKVGMFKGGNQIFTGAGPDSVRELVARGEKVFLAVKYHDIRNRVAGAVSSASQLGVSLLTVHALGGAEMLQAAVGALPAMGVRLLAVTVLTSHSEESLR